MNTKDIVHFLLRIAFIISSYTSKSRELGFLKLEESLIPKCVG